MLGPSPFQLQFGLAHRHAAGCGDDLALVEGKLDLPVVGSQTVETAADLTGEDRPECTPQALVGEQGGQFVRLQSRHVRKIAVDFAFPFAACPGGADRMAEVLDRLQAAPAEVADPEADLPIAQTEVGGVEIDGLQEPAERAGLLQPLN